MIRVVDGIDAETRRGTDACEVSVVIPCLNEHETVATCVRKALYALDEAGINGEVIVADNGSTDGSIELANAAGARVVPVTAKGYGNALMGGITAARGEFIVMGDADDVTRFNESIDQSLAKAVSSYTKRVDQSRDLFLAILSHDLRNPLNSIAMSASLLPHLVSSATEAIDVVSQISSNAGVMAKMISDLLDYTRTRLGAGMPVSPAMMDLGALC